MVRHYECECLICRAKSTLIFHEEPFPEVGQEFLYHCPSCGKETYYTRSMNKKAIAELHRKQQEEDMKRSIILKCDEYGFQYRFLYQSVIITTALADWCFDYHQRIPSEAKNERGSYMITLTLIIVIIMLLMWLGLSSLGVAFSDGLGWFLFLAAIAIVFILYGLVSGWFKRR